MDINSASHVECFQMASENPFVFVKHSVTFALERCYLNKHTLHWGGEVLKIFKKHEV